MNWTTFLTNARKAVTRVGLWILKVLAKRLPNLVAGYLQCKIDHLRDRLKDKKTELGRKWLKVRITAWSWVLRWVNSLPVRSAITDLAKRAESELVRLSDKVIPIRAEQETYPGFARMLKRKTERLKRRTKRVGARRGRRKARKAKRQARRAA